MCKTAIDLTAGTRWEWRAAIDGVEGAWAGSVVEALAGANTGVASLQEWPLQWTAFFLPETGKPQLRARGVEYALPPPPAEVLMRVPESLTLSNARLERRIVTADTRGLIDLVPQLGAAHDARTAFLFASVEVSTVTSSRPVMSAA